MRELELIRKKVWLGEVLMKDVAKKAGISRQYLYLILNKKKVPSYEVLKKLMELVGVKK